MHLLSFIMVFILLSTYSCGVRTNNKNIEENILIYSNRKASGQELVLKFEKGEAHNYPSFVVWIEDLKGNYIETLYITKSVGTGIFNYGEPEKGKWIPSQKRYPASLPYWGHKRGVAASDGLYIPDSTSYLIDGITGATPQTNFDLYTRLTDPELKNFNLLFEVNQTWDFNEYWTNNKFPDNEAYKVSCQPSVIYSAQIDLNNRQKEYELKPIGHGHYAGETGELFVDLGTLTTALKIVGKLTLKFQ